MPVPSIPGLPAGATLGAPVQQATPVTGLPAGATLGAPVSQDTAISDQSSQASAPVHNDEIRYGDSTLGNIAKTPVMALEGVGEGVFKTAAGASDILDRATGQQPGTVNKFLHTEAGDNNTPGSSTVANKVGNGLEGLGEFLLGDEALKGATLSERLLSAGKAAKVVESSPRLTAIVKAGLQALGKGALIGGTQGALKSGGDLNATAGGAAAGGVGNVVIPGAISAAKELPELFNTLRTVIRPGIIQDAFQGDIRRIINEAAQEHGVAPSNAASIRDVAHDVASNLQQRAKQAYQALDDATGGRVQRFSDSIKAVQKKLSNLNGIASPDDEGAWVEKLNELTDAHEKAMAEAEAAGVPRTLLDQANADYRKSKAMADLNRAIRASSEGLRPELASGANKPLPEKVNTGKLFARVNKLYDSKRLQDAVGAGRSGDLLRATNDAHAASQTAQNLRQLAGSTAKHTLYYGATWELLKHLLGE